MYLLLGFVPGLMESLATAEFDTSFDTELGFSYAFRKLLSGINGPVYQPVV